MRPQPRTAKTPRELAEACFAVARSTAHAGERSAAIGRGEAICARHGLDLDSFNVPGRAKAQSGASSAAASPPPRSRFSFTAGSYAGPSGPDMLRAMEEMIRAAEEGRQRAQARADESVYEARRRNFEAAEAAARKRDEARREAEEKKVQRAVAFLRQHGFDVFEVTKLSVLSTRSWSVFYQGKTRSASDGDVIELYERCVQRQAAEATMRAARDARW